MDKKEGNPRSGVVEEKWWHFAIVGVVLTVVGVAVLGLTAADLMRGPADAAAQQAQWPGGASLIEVSSAPSK